MRSTITGAKPSEGSSSRKIAGRDISARPIANICCSPPERLPARWLGPLAQSREIRENPIKALMHFRRRATVGADLQVLPDRECGKYAASFRRIANAETNDLERLQAFQRLAVEQDITLGIIHHAEDRLERTALSGAVGTHDRHRLADAELE